MTTPDPAALAKLNIAEDAHRGAVKWLRANPLPDRFCYDAFQAGFYDALERLSQHPAGDGGWREEPELPFTPMELTNVIAGALPKGSERVGHPTPAQCAAMAVLEHVEARLRGETTKHRRSYRSEAAVVLYDHFGPKYSRDYDGPRPIDARFFAIADEIATLRPLPAPPTAAPQSDEVK